MKHTAEPWETSANSAGEFDVCVAGAGDMIADLAGCGDNQEANAKRIVECVNACEGLNPEGIAELLKAVDSLLQNIYDAEEHLNTVGEEYEDVKRVARAWDLVTLKGDK